MSEWWKRINTEKGLTAEQLKSVVDQFGEKTDPHSGDDFWGGFSEGFDAALEIIIDIVGMKDADQ